MRLHCQITPRDYEDALRLMQELKGLGQTPTFDGEEVALDYVCDGAIDNRAQAIIGAFERYGCDRLIVYDSGGTAGEVDDSGGDGGDNGELNDGEDDGSSTQSAPRKNIHHLLYQRRHWSDGGEWARKLRGHAYMQVSIPRDTLHCQIHKTIHDVPVPNEDVCEEVWQELERLKRAQLINCRADRADMRLGVLIQILSEYGGNLEATIAVLRWQQQVVQKFYTKSPQ